MTDHADEKSEGKGSLLDRALGVFTEVKAGEGVTVLLLTLNVFLLLMAYYVIKPVREALIGSVPNGPQLKSYMGAAIAVSLFVIVPLYGALAAKLQRNVLIKYVSFFFVGNLVIFFGLQRIPWLQADLGATIFACGFLVWVGIFNLMIVAQFWAFAADIYTDDEGKRLFAMVAVGASLGSVVGSLLVERAVKQLGTEYMMLIAAGILAGATLITGVIHRRESERISKKGKPDKSKEAIGASTNAYSMVFGNKYLILIAFFTLLFSLVNTSGEYMISQLFSDAAKVEVPMQEGMTEAALKAAQKAWIAEHFGSYFLWVNIAGVVIQSFLVSRIVKYGGLKVAIMIFPVLSFFSEGTIAVSPVLGTVRVCKTAENSLDYSLNNTVRNMLWLPTTRQMKYVAKQVVDSFFARMGDVGSAGSVLLFVNLLGLGVRAIATFNTVLVGVWIVVTILIIRENKRLTDDLAKKDPEAAAKVKEATT